MEYAATLIQEFKSKSTPTVSDINIPFSRVDVDFEHITINDCTENIQFEKIGNRKVAYFGDVSYIYPGKQHDPCEYPETPIFDTIFSEIEQIQFHMCSDTV